jgi:hypothetical protein
MRSQEHECNPHLAVTRLRCQRFGFVPQPTDSFGIEELSLEADPIELPECPVCGVAVIMDKSNMMSYYIDLKITCRACGKVHDVGEEAEQTAG